MEIKAVFYSDASHGWLAVKYATAFKYGITAKISGYSYLKGKTVYLEEDCDANLFIRAVEATGDKVSIVDVDHGDRSPIRNYPQLCELAR